MLTTGFNAVSTNGAAPITLISKSSVSPTNFSLIITGTNASFISFDNGSTWGYLPGASDATHPFTMLLINSIFNGGILLQRVPGTSNDVTGIYAWAQ